MDVLLQDKVFIVGCKGLLVGRVRRILLHAVDEILVKVHLPDVRCRRVDEGIVGLRLGVDVCHDVDVCCPAGVVTREERFELGYAVGVGLLYAA